MLESSKSPNAVLLTSDLYTCCGAEQMEDRCTLRSHRMQNFPGFDVCTLGRWIRASN